MTERRGGRLKKKTRTEKENKGGKKKGKKENKKEKGEKKREEETKHECREKETTVPTPRIELSAFWVPSGSEAKPLEYGFQHG